MIKEKSEIISIVDSIAHSLQMINDLPPDIAHYTWDEKRIGSKPLCGFNFLL